MLEMVAGGMRIYKGGRVRVSGFLDWEESGFLDRGVRVSGEMLILIYSVPSIVILTSIWL